MTAPVVVAPPESLLKWAPEAWPVASGWQKVLASFLQTDAAHQLGQFMQHRLAVGATVYPPQPFRALELTPPEDIRVVILGQDPYHGPRQAQGLAFSVASGVAVPPSLRNIYKELAREATQRQPILSSTPVPVLPARPLSADGSLEHWARQGVLLLNTCLTVEQGQPASHAKQGWEVLTDQLIQTVGAGQSPVVFMLWGAHAQAKQSLIAAGRHLVLTANHPSPLSALRPPKPFIGCEHFSQANAFLIQQGFSPIGW